MEYDLYQHTILIRLRQNNVRSTLNLESSFARAGETTYRDINQLINCSITGGDLKC